MHNLKNIKDVWNNEALVKTLTAGGIAVMPTDTIYGIAGRAESLRTVEKIYEIRKRNSEKPCIILIGDINQLEEFSIHITEAQRNIIQNYWPARNASRSDSDRLSSGESKARPTSIILDCMSPQLSYLHRGTHTLAFRMPADIHLQNVLKDTGPLIAPSANPEGERVANTIDEAKKYFGDAVDFYLDGGEIQGQASTVIRLHPDGTVSVVRE